MTHLTGKKIFSTSVKQLHWTGMRKRIFLTFALIIFAGCSSAIVKEEKLDKLNANYTGVYEVIVIIKDPSLRSPLPIGMKVKIFFESNSDSFRVYAYPANQSYEESVARQIVYLIEDDFPDGQFSEQVLDAELKKLVIRSK